MNKRTKKVKEKSKGKARKLLKYTKPYLLLVFITIGLLFAQANLDLSLPNYLSDIVDTGIQQGGVEYAVPVAIRQDAMNNNFLFMSSENQTSVLSKYRPVDENSSDYSLMVDLYPVLENESIYVLDDVTNDEIKELNDLLKEPLVVTLVLTQAMANPENATLIWADLGIDPSMLPPGTDIFDVIGTFSYENRTILSGFLTAQFDAIGETMIDQMAVAAVLFEHEIVGLDADKIQSRYILKSGGFMLLMTFLSVICTVIVSLLASRTAAGMARDIRSDLFKRVENFSATEFDTFSTASLITRSTNDVTQIQNVVIMIMRLVFYAPILGVGGIIQALNKNASMWWLIGVAVGVLLLLILIVMLIAVPKFNQIQKLTDRINLVARENLTGMLVIRAFNREKQEEKRFDKANKDLTSVMLFINRVMVVMFPFMMLIMQGLMLSIIWIGSHEVADAAMQVGDMMAFMQYAMQIVMAFLMLTMMFIILPRAIVSARRISEVLYTKPVIVDPVEPTTFPEEFKGEITFDHVSFMYPGAKAPVLHDVSFTAKPGETTAIIGATGSGKTTIINLIPRLYDVTRGSILIDGVDIRQVTQHDLRDRIGYVPQKSYLFSGTIESNLLFADENADRDTLHDALDTAQATEFVSTKPEGIESEIAQGGANVSGGQKQRLSIARAMVKRPPIYIFDDSVSALDFKTDAALRQALKKKTGDSTVIMVTQRVSTIKEAEQILVIDDGQILGKGTHDELMETCGVYKEIAISQLELEEF